MTRYDQIMQKVLSMPEDFAHSDEGRSLLAEALTPAPLEIKVKMDAKLKELGILPEVRFCDDNGRPLFTLEQVAESLGVPLDEVRRRVEDLTEHHLSSGKMTGPIHRVH